MANIGDTITTSDGRVLRLMPKPVKDEEVTLETLASILEQINVNLSILIDIDRWIGKYISLEDTIDADSSHAEYTFNFPLRYIRIGSDQPLKIQFNDIGNPIINISAGEFPYTLPDIRPGFVIKTLYITTGAVDTKITLLGFG